MELTDKQLDKATLLISKVENSELKAAYVVLFDYCFGKGFDGAGAIRYEDLPKGLQEIINETLLSDVLDATVIATELLQKALPKYTIVELRELLSNSKILKAAINGVIEMKIAADA